MTLINYIDSRALQLGSPNDYVLKQSLKIDVIAARAKMIRNQFTATKTFPQSAIVALKCLALTKVPSTDCCSVDLGCNILKSTSKIPRPIEVKDTVNFNYVGSVDSKSEWGWIKPEEVRFIKHRKWSSKDIFYTWLNDYIYVFNDLSPKKFTIRYPVADLIEAEALKNCDGEPCISIDYEIEIEDHWINDIDKIILPNYRNVQDQQIKVDEVE